MADFWYLVPIGSVHTRFVSDKNSKATRRNSQDMHPRAIKLNALFSVNDFKTTYERSEGLGMPRPREINLSTLYANYFAYEPSMNRPAYIAQWTDHILTGP